MNREQLAKKAENIARAAKGLDTDLPMATQKACQEYGSIRAEMLVQVQPPVGGYGGCVSIESQGSLECVQDESTGVLVFCSAKRPGGGWLTGATAQEESISRASTWALSCEHPVFHSDTGNDGYFYKNAVLSVAGKILERNNTPLAIPGPVHFVGMCAPNARAIQEHGLQPESNTVRKKIIDALVIRMRLALQSFALVKCNTVILGAVG